MLHNGLWATPNLAFWSLIAEDPGNNPFRAGLAGDYLLTNLSTSSLAAVVGQTAPHEYARLHLVVLVVAWAAVVALAWRRLGYEVARALTVVLAAAPLVTVSMQWLGQPDPLTGLCGVAMVLARRRWALVALAVVAGLSHPEQALFMAVVAAAVRPLVPPAVSPARSPVIGPTGASGEDVTASTAETWWPEAGIDAIAAVGGVLAGRILTQLWFTVNDIVVSTPRTDYLRFGVDGFVEHHSRQPLGLLWTLWGPLWLVIAGAAAAISVGRRRRSNANLEDPEPTPEMVVISVKRPKRRYQPGVSPADRALTAWFGSVATRRLAVGAGLAAVLALVPVAVTLDETRVYAVITAPLLVALAVLAARLVPSTMAAWAAAGFLAVTAAIPGGFATGITSWRSQLPTGEMVVFLADGSLPERALRDEAEGDLTTWLLEPFDFVIPDLPDPPDD